MPIKTKRTFNDCYLEFKNEGNKYKNLSLDQYLNVIQHFFRQVANNFIACNDTGKIQVALKLLFLSSKDTGEEKELHL